MPIAYVIKVGVGFYFLYIYTSVYGNGSLSADAGAFMEESAILNEVFYQSPIDYFKLLTGIGDQTELVGKYLMDTDHWDSGAQAIISDNRNIMRFHSVLHFISFKEAAIHVLVMCFFSLIGIKQLYLGIKKRTTMSSSALFAILLIFPSVLFWSSGILKEPLLILGIGLFVRGILKQKGSSNKWLFIILGGLLMIGFKPYVFISMIPGIVFYGLYSILPKYKIALGLSIIMLIGISSIFLFPTQRDKLVHTLTLKQYDFKNVGKGGLHVLTDDCFYFFEPDQISELIIEGDSVTIDHVIEAQEIQFGSIDDATPVTLSPPEKKWQLYFRNDKSDGYIDITMINHSFSQLIFNIPEALLNSLFRPFPMDPGSWLKYPAMIEILLLYGFLIFAIAKRRTLKSKDKALITSIVLFVISLSLIIGWVTPVLGAIVRYRTPTFIGILLIALILVQRKKTTHE
ncbi:MAG: hypothetical protein QNK23_09025 [Crocinitomicaceae bacterium]|nr:hypothetical protein [Crocinitomicaceae bacterium]